MPIHPKAAGATFAAALAAVIMAILTQSGVHINLDLATSIEGLVAFVGGWLPSSPTPVVVAVTPAAAATPLDPASPGFPGFPPV